MEEPHSSKSIPNTDESIVCKNCKKTFKKTSISKHISAKKDCKAKYTEDELMQLKNSSKLRKNEADAKRNYQNYDPTCRQGKYQMKKNQNQGVTRTYNTSGNIYINWI